MEKKVNNIDNSKLTDEQLEGVVGGQMDWDGLIRYLKKKAPGRRDVDELVYAVCDKKWDRALIIATKILKSDPNRFADGIKYLE